jgi:hypothetical protein
MFFRALDGFEPLTLKITWPPDPSLSPFRANYKNDVGFLVFFLLMYVRSEQIKMSILLCKKQAYYIYAHLQPGVPDLPKALTFSSPGGVV